jgi:PAS domain S-box-containing protein
VDESLHDMRNDLAVAIGTLHALIDGKLPATPARYADMLAALQNLDAEISARRPRAAALNSREKENLLAAVVEGSPFANVLVDARGHIALVNALTEQLFGYARDELLGRSIELLVPERFRHGHSGLREGFGLAPAARPMGAGRDLYGRRKDGTEMPIEIGLNPVRSGGVAYTLAAITDITERRRNEEMRSLHSGMQQHAVELEELNRELASASRFKTQFVATMSHELRTPLSAIVGAAELLGRAKLDERAKISVQTISEAAEALFALINSVLDFSKIEAGKLELRTVAFEVESVVEGAADVVAQLAHERGITLYTYVEPGLPALSGDADRLRQILLNLLGNAVKFTEHGHVVARVSAASVTPAAVTLRFEVQDTGIGIPADVVVRLFEPFAQADRSTSRRFGGTGLGLSISKRLIELMDGTIGVDSEPGAGSLFWFSATFAPAGDVKRRRRELEGLGGIVLSGDDTFAEIVERYMASWSIRCRRAYSRADVVDALQANEVPGWIAIVDLDDLGAADLGVTIDIMRAILPERVIAVGSEAGLRKPLHGSELFDAIVRAVGPKEPVPAAPPSAEPFPFPPALGPILVAEDDARLQRLLRIQFEDLGVEAHFVSDGRQAVEALLEHRYAMVFMDCQMPNLDGLAAARSIRASERIHGGRTPMVAMTANAFAEDRAACLDAGMDDYLAKPVRLGDLRAMLERWANPARVHDIFPNVR